MWLCFLGNLKNHYRINHSTEHVMRCGQCEFQTSSQRTFREHFKKHESSVRPFMCPTCQYTCASRTTLKVHQRIHSDERPYKCNYCVYSSRQSGNIRTHMRRKHPDRLRSSTLKKIIKKEDPKPQGQVPGSLEAKGSEIRKGKGVGERIRPVCKKPFQCMACDAAFVREDSLRSHMRQHRDVDRDMALKVENTALAVLQLSNPVTIDGKKILNADEPLHPQDAHIHGNQGHEVVIEASPRLLSDSSPAPSVAPVIAAGPVSTNTTRTVTTAHPSHSHILNQAASNRLAFVQNNQNKAIEDNFQNAAISLNRAQAATRRPRTSWAVSQPNATLTERVVRQPVPTSSPNVMYHVQPSANIVQNIQNLNRVRVATRPVQQQQIQLQQQQQHQQHRLAQVQQQQQTVTVSSAAPVTSQHIQQVQQISPGISESGLLSGSTSIQTIGAGQQQLLDASTVAAIQTQLSQIHPPGTPISIQIVQVSTRDLRMSRNTTMETAPISQVKGENN